MEVIGPQRIHHSPFAALAHAQPRSRQMLETFHQQSSTAGASATTASRSTTAAASRDKASGRNKKGRDSVHPPRIREDKRPATERPQQQQQPQQQRRSTTETRKLENSGASSAIATVATPASSTTEKGREARSSTSESRRQPPRQQNQRRWTKNSQGRNRLSGSGPNSPRPSSSTGTVGSRTSRRKINSDRGLGENDYYNKQMTPDQQQQQQTSVSSDVVPDSKPKAKAEGRTGRKRSSAKRSRGVTAMSSIDSGKGEDLSSSCESSVFDSQENEIHSCKRHQSPAHLMESRGQRSRHSSCSSIDEFHDALSHPASDDEDGMNSSAFVTPFSTRSHSPTYVLEEQHVVQRQNSVLSNESSIDELRLSLKRLSQDRQDGIQASHDSIVIQCTEDHMNLDGGHMTAGLPPQATTSQATSTRTEPQVNSTGQQSTFTLTHTTVELSTSEGLMTLHDRNRKERQVTNVTDSGNSSAPPSPAKKSRRSLPAVVAPAIPTLSSPSPLLLPLSAPPAGHPPMLPSSSPGSGASPQSSVCSHSTRPHSPSTPSQSPAPSTPSQLSPSPSPAPAPVPLVAGDTVARDIVDEVALASYKNDQLCQACTNDDQTATQEDEWPDLHSPLMTEVGVQPVEPHPTQEYSNESEGCQSVLDAQYSNPSTVNDRITGEISGPYPSPNSTNKEVRGHPFEPHPQNAAAAYPHMIHHAPYTMRWQYFGPIPTTGSYGYYNVPFGPQTGYYPTSPHMMWPPVTSPPVHQPPQYYRTSPPNSAHPDFSTSTDAQDSLQESNGAPPTSLNEDRPASVAEAEAQSSEEEQELHEREQLEGDEGEGEGDAGDEGEGEGEAGDGAVESDSISDVCEVTPVSSPTCHPLEATWVMWYDKITGTTRNHRSDYRSSLKHLYTISSVEDFWRLYNNIRQPSHLDRNSNYHFFKEGIDPMWEDPANAEGGKWVLTVKDDEGVLDNAWEELLLAMIGGLIQSCHAINGAVVSRRKKGDRVALWTRKKSVKVNLDICADLLKVLVIACDISRDDLSDFVHQLSDGRDGLTLVYMYHTDSLKSGTSYQNSAHIHLRDNCEALIAMVMKKLTGC